MSHSSRVGADCDGPNRKTVSRPIWANGLLVRAFFWSHASGAGKLPAAVRRPTSKSPLTYTPALSSLFFLSFFCSLGFFRIVYRRRKKPQTQDATCRRLHHSCMYEVLLTYMERVPAPGHEAPSTGIEEPSGMPSNKRPPRRPDEREKIQ